MTDITDAEAMELGQKARIGHVRLVIDASEDVDGLWWTDEHVWERVGGASCGPWQYPTLINDWENAGDPYCDIAYRLCVESTGSELQFTGHITGGVSGSIAFYLLADWWPHCDLSTITDVDLTGSLGAAQIYVASADGAVTITTIV